MKTYTTKQLRRKINGVPDNAKMPEEYARVFNKNHSGTPGGRAWIMWFLDFVDGGPSIELPPEDIYPFREVK